MYIFLTFVMESINVYISHSVLLSWVWIMDGVCIITEAWKLTWKAVWGTLFASLLPNMLINWVTAVVGLIILVSFGVLTYSIIKIPEVTVIKTTRKIPYIV